MKEHLLYFVFLGALTAIGVNAAIDWVHAHFFATSLTFQQDWALLFVAVPAAALLALAFALGFFRRSGERWADGLVLLIGAGLVYATLGAGYSCWKYCF